MNLLCVLGLHDWKYNDEHKYYADHGTYFIPLNERTCKRCRKTEYITFYNGKFGVLGPYRDDRTEEEKNKE